MGQRLLLGEWGPDIARKCHEGSFWYDVSVLYLDGLCDTGEGVVCQKSLTITYMSSCVIEPQSNNKTTQKEMQRSLH